MNTAKIILIASLAGTITGLALFKIVQGKPVSKFDQCINSLGGATDSNCVKCEHLLNSNN